MGMLIKEKYEGWVNRSNILGVIQTSPYTFPSLSVKMLCTAKSWQILQCFQLEQINAYNEPTHLIFTDVIDFGLC